MKANMWMVGWVFASTFAFGGQADGLPSGGEIPAVRKVAIVAEEGCGAAPQSFSDSLPCPGTDRVTFEVETTGDCELFTTEVDQAGGESYLSIVRQKAPNCTRRTHAPRFEAKTLILADELKGSVRLGNPLVVETHIRQ